MERKTKKRHNKHHLDKRILSKRRNTMSGGGTYDEYNQIMAEDETHWNSIIDEAKPLYDDYRKLQIKYDELKRVLFEISAPWDRGTTEMPVFSTVSNVFTPFSSGKQILDPLRNRQGQVYYFHKKIRDAISLREDELDENERKLSNNKLLLSNIGANKITYEISDMVLETRNALLKQIIEQLKEMLLFIEKPENANEWIKSEISNRLNWIKIDGDYYGIAKKAGIVNAVAQGGPGLPAAPTEGQFSGNLEALKTKYNELRIKLDNIVSEFQQIQITKILVTSEKLITQIDVDKSDTDKESINNTKKAFEKYIKLLKLIKDLGYYDVNAGQNFSWGDYIEKRRVESGYAYSVQILKFFQRLFPDGKLKADSTTKINNFDKLYTRFNLIYKDLPTSLDQQNLLTYGEVFEKHDDISYLNDELNSIFSGLTDDSQHMCDLTCRILTDPVILRRRLNDAAYNIIQPLLPDLPLLAQVQVNGNLNVSKIINLVPAAIKNRFANFSVDVKTAIENVVTANGANDAGAQRLAFVTAIMGLANLQVAVINAGKRDEIQTAVTGYIDNVTATDNNANKVKTTVNTDEHIGYINNMINTLLLDAKRGILVNILTDAVITPLIFDDAAAYKRLRSFLPGLPFTAPPAAAPAAALGSSRTIQIKRAIALASYPDNKLFQLIVNILSDQDIGAFLVSGARADRYDLLRGILENVNIVNGIALLANDNSPICDLPRVIPTNVTDFVQYIPFAVVSAYDRAYATVADAANAAIPAMSIVDVKRDILIKIFSKGITANGGTPNTIHRDLIVAAVNAATVSSRNAYNSLRNFIRGLPSAANAGGAVAALVARFKTSIECSFPLKTIVNYDTTGKYGACLSIGGNCVYIIETTAGSVSTDGSVSTYGKIIKRIYLENNETVNSVNFCNKNEELLLGLYTCGSASAASVVVVAGSNVKAVPSFNNIKLINWTTGKLGYEQFVGGITYNLTNTNSLIKLTYDREQFAVGYVASVSMRYISSGDEITNIPAVGANVSQLAINSDGSIIIASNAGNIYGWKLNETDNSYEVINAQAYDSRGADVSNIVFSNDTHFVVSYGANIKVINVNDAQTGYDDKGSAVEVESGVNVNCMTYCSNYTYFAVGLNREGRTVDNVFIYKVKGDKTLETPQKIKVATIQGKHTESIESISCNNGQTLLIGKSDFSTNFQNVQFENTVTKVPVNGLTSVSILEYTPNFGTATKKTTDFLSNLFSFDSNPDNYNLTPKIAFTKTGKNGIMYLSNFNTQTSELSNQETINVSSKIKDEYEIKHICFDNNKSIQSSSDFIVAAGSTKELVVIQGSVPVASVTVDNDIISISYNSTYSCILVGTKTTIYTYKLSSNKSLKKKNQSTIDSTTPSFTKVLISPDGKYGVAGCESGIVYSFNISDFSISDIKKCSTAQLNTPVTCLKFYNDDKLLCGYKSGAFVTWNIDKSSDKSFTSNMKNLFSNKSDKVNTPSSEDDSLKSPITSISVYNKDYIAVSIGKEIYFYESKYVQGSDNNSYKPYAAEYKGTGVTYVYLTSKTSFIDNENGTVNTISFFAQNKSIITPSINGNITSITNLSDKLYILGISDVVANNNYTNIMYTRTINIYDSKTNISQAEFTLNRGNRYNNPTIIRVNPTNNTEIIVGYGNSIDIFSYDATLKLTLKNKITLDPPAPAAQVITICDITYNSKGKQFVVSFGSKVKIYNYNTRTNNWLGLVKDLNIDNGNVNISSFTYSDVDANIIILSYNSNNRSSDVACYDVIKLEKLWTQSPFVPLANSISTFIATSSDFKYFAVGLDIVGNYKITIPEKVVDVHKIYSLPIQITYTNNIFVYDSATRKKQFEICALGGSVKQMVYSNDNRLIYVNVDNSQYCPVQLLLSSYLYKYADELVNVRFSDRRNSFGFVNVLTDILGRGIGSSPILAANILICLNYFRKKPKNAQFDPVTDFTAENIRILATIPMFTSIIASTNYICILTVLLLDKLNLNIVTLGAINANVTAIGNRAANIPALLTAANAAGAGDTQKTAYKTALSQVLSVSKIEVDAVKNANPDDPNAYLKSCLQNSYPSNSNLITRNDINYMANQCVTMGKRCVNILYATIKDFYEEWLQQYVDDTDALKETVYDRITSLNAFYMEYINSLKMSVSINNIQIFDGTTGKYNNSYYAEDTDILTSSSSIIELTTVTTNSRKRNVMRWVDSEIQDTYDGQYTKLQRTNDTIDLDIFSNFYNSFQSNFNYYTWRKPFFKENNDADGKIGIESRILTLIKDYVKIDPILSKKFDRQLTQYNDKLYNGNADAELNSNDLNLNTNQRKSLYFDSDYDFLNFRIHGRDYLVLNTAQVLPDPRLLTLTNENIMVTTKQAKNYEGDFYRIYREYKTSVLYSGTAKSYEYFPHGYGTMYYLLDSTNTNLFKKETAYRGLWKDSKYNGYGELCYGNFKDNISPVYIYRGFWVNDLQYGPGIKYYGDTRFTNKIVYIGNFINDEYYGQGLYLKEYDPSTKKGKIYSGYWINNKLGWTDDSFKTQSNNVRIVEYDGSDKPKSIYVGQVIKGENENGPYYIPYGEGKKTEIDTVSNKETVKQGNFNNGKLSGQNASITTIDKKDNKVTVQSGIFKDGNPILVKEDVTITTDGKETKTEKAQLFTYDDKGVTAKGSPVDIEVAAVNEPTKVPENYKEQVEKDINEIKTEKTQQDQRVKDTGRGIATSLRKEVVEEGKEGVVEEDKEGKEGEATSLTTGTTKTHEEIVAEQQQKKADTDKQIEGDKQSFAAMKQLQTGKYVKLVTNFTDGQNTSIIKFGKEYKYIGPASKQQNDNQILISREYGRLEKLNGDILIPANSVESRWSKVVVTDKKYKDDAELPPEWTEYRPYAIFDIIPKDSEVAKMFSQSVTDALFSTTTPDQSKSFIGDTSTLEKMSHILYRDIVIYVNAYIQVLEKLMGGKTPKMNASGEQVDSCGRPIQKIQSGGTRTIEEITKAIEAKNAEIIALKEANDKAIADPALSSSDPTAAAAVVKETKDKLETAESELSGLKSELATEQKEAEDAIKAAEDKKLKDAAEDKKLKDAAAEALKKKQEEELEPVIDLTGAEEEKTDVTTAPQSKTTVGPDASEFDTFINNMYNNLTADDSEYQSFKNMDPNIIQDLPLDDNFVKSVLNAIIASVSPNAQNLLSSDSIGKYDDIQVLLILNKNIIILFSMYLIVISKLSVEDPFVVLNMYNGFRQAYNKTMKLKQVPNMEENAEEIFNNQTTNAFIKSILAALAFSVTAGGVTAAASGMFSPTMGGKKYTRRKKVIKKQYNTKRQRKLNLKGKKYVTRKLRKKRRVKKNKDKKK